MLQLLSGLIGLVLIGSITAGTQPCFLGQGQMAGEVTADSVILQTRITASQSPVDGDMPGYKAAACFEFADNRDFNKSIRTSWQQTQPESDYIIQKKITGLAAGTEYFYRALYGPDEKQYFTGPIGRFRTLDGESRSRSVRIAVVTGMNYAKFYASYPNASAPAGHPGYPALKTILDKKTDFLVLTGDNVYFDVPADNPARTEVEIRKKYHEQFCLPNYIELFASVATYWEKDDHDYRYNDCDNSNPMKAPSVELCKRLYREQAPVISPNDPLGKPYRTVRINRDLQIWLLEGREYRSANVMPDGPEKTIWGDEQKQWLHQTLLASSATFKIVISPTPLVGPEDAYKNDNHTLTKGFLHEGLEFFKWLKENQFDKKNFYLVCGDRHWQYHSIHPSGFEEFSCGALVTENARAGRLPGDPQSTDPQAHIKQPYCMQEPNGGFLQMTVHPSKDNQPASLVFGFYKDDGTIFYSVNKAAQ